MPNSKAPVETDENAKPEETKNDAPETEDARSDNSDNEANANVPEATAPVDDLDASDEFDEEAHDDEVFVVTATMLGLKHRRGDVVTHAQLGDEENVLRLLGNRSIAPAASLAADAAIRDRAMEDAAVKLHQQRG